MAIQPIYVDEPCPLEGYDDLRVRVLANASDAQWRDWVSGNMGVPGCPDCAALRQPTVQRGRRRAGNAPTPEPDPRAFCPACLAARERFGRAICRFYGPALLGEHDVSTPEAALALLDSDDVLPSEIVIWLQLVPSAVRDRRTEQLLGNLISSATTPKN